MSQATLGTTADTLYSRVRKPILIAGVLGGLLGGICSFAAARFIKPATPTPVKSANEVAADEARAVVEEYLALLRAYTPAKTDEFLFQLKIGYSMDLSDEKAKEVFKAMESSFINGRLRYEREFGKPLHQFELIRETAFSPNLVEFTYQERYERGGPIWRFVMYRATDRWRIALMEFRELELGIKLS